MPPSLKLARLNDGRTIVSLPSGEFALDLSTAISARAPGTERLADKLGAGTHESWTPLIEHWTEAREALAGLVDEASTSGSFITDPVDSLTFAAPLPDIARARIFALGGNFAKHVADASKAVFGEDSDMHRSLLNDRRAQGPWGFITLPDTVVGNEATIAPPTGIQKLDYEGEVAVVLESGGRDLAAEEIRIWGYTAWSDFSLRDSALGLGPTYDGGPMTWSLQKNFDSGSTGGPWLVAGCDQPLDVDSIGIETRVNGETRQNGSTEEMIFSFAETAEHLSHFLTLRAGDMIASGTPAGTAVESGVDGPYLSNGDLVEVQVEGVGVLRNHVVTKEENK